MNTPPDRVDVRRVLEILRHQESTLAWVNAMDSADLLDPSYKEVVPDLLDALQNANPDMRLYCMRALRRIQGKDDGVLAAAATLALDRDRYVQLEVTRLLSEHGSSNTSLAVPALILIASDWRASITTRWLAFRALRRFGGSCFRASGS